MLTKRRWRLSGPDRGYEYCPEAAVVPQIIDAISGVYGNALDPTAAHRLWERSQEFVDITGLSR